LNSDGDDVNPHNPIFVVFILIRTISVDLLQIVLPKNSKKVFILKKEF
jgi:hypothetical protein